MRNGKIVATLQATDDNQFSGRLYLNCESRGYQTNFNQEPFYYLITFKNQLPTHIEGVTKDSRRKTFLQPCADQKIALNIVDKAYFDKWVS
jgi:hypothetical protein